MKTHVIHLASHDDYHSARDQMTWAKSARILLVLPRKDKILRTRLDLVLLERQAVSLGAQLALVTDDEVVLGNAEELKIPVFETIKEAQHKSWKVSGKKKWIRRYQRQNRSIERTEFHKNEGWWFNRGSTWFRVIVFSTGVLAILILLVVLLPEAEIRISPTKRQQSVQFTLRADPSVKHSNLSGLVPLKSMIVHVSEKQIRQSSGSVQVGDTPASGELTVTNLTDSPLTIPSGTIFITMTEPTQRFLSEQPVKLAGRIGATAQIPIEAMFTGTLGNVDKGSIQGVEGPIGLKISVNNVRKLDNGTDRQNAAPTEQDLAELDKLVSQALQRSAFEEMKNQSGTEGIVLMQSLILKTVTSRIQDPEIGTPSDTISLETSAEYSGNYVAAEDIQSAAELILDANLPEGYQSIGDKINIIYPPSTKENGVWEVQADRTIQAKINPSRIAQLASGRKIADFIKLLHEMAEVEGEPKIWMKPFFMGRFPLLAMRIQVSELK
jgi:hypothetical protein